MWHANEITMMVMVVDEEVADTAKIVVVGADIVMIVIEMIVVGTEVIEETGVVLIIVETGVVIAIIMMVGEEIESTMIGDVVEMISVAEDAIETIRAVLFAIVLLNEADIAEAHQGGHRDVVTTVDAVVLEVVLCQGFETTIKLVEEALPDGTMNVDGTKIMAIDLKRMRVAVPQIIIADVMTVVTVLYLQMRLPYQLVTTQSQPST